MMFFIIYTLLLVLFLFLLDRKIKHGPECGQPQFRLSPFIAIPLKSLEEANNE